MSDHVKPECRPRTADQYRVKLDKYILPRFGHLALTELDRMGLKKWFAELDGGQHARMTVQNTLIPLRAMLNSALRDGLIGSNPATTLKRSNRARAERDSNEVAAYSTQELEAILEAARSAQHLYSDLYHTLAQSGLRLSEACGLKPLDIATGYLTVRRDAQYAHGRLDIFSPKSGKARRVDIPASLEAKLRAREGDWTFPSLTDPVKPLNPTEARDQWHKLLAKIGARKLRLHDLRHTYACLLLQRGAPPSYVKEQLGHSSIQVTIDIYGHMIPGANRRWIDETFGGKEP